MHEFLQLDGLNILKQTKLPLHLSWMNEGEKQSLLLIHLCGEGGMLKKEVAKLDKQYPDVLFKLEARGLLSWQTNSHGKNVALALTWKGEEISKLLHLIAKNDSKKQ